MCCIGNFLKCGVIMILSIVALGGGFYLGWWTRDYRDTQKAKSPAPKANVTKTSSLPYADIGYFTPHSRDSQTPRDMPAFYLYDRTKGLQTGSDRSDAVSMNDVKDTASSAWYGVEQDRIQVSPDVGKKWLDAIKDTYKLDTSGMKPFTADLARYLRNTDQAAMQSLRDYASSNGKLPDMSDSTQLRLKDTLSVPNLMDWLQHPMEARDTMMGPHVVLQDSHLQAARAAFDSQHPNTMLSQLTLMDPAQQIVAHAERMRTTSRVRRSSYRRRLMGGVETMEPMCIGVVVHVLQYQDSQGFRAPLNAYSLGDAPIQTLLDTVNRAYEVDSIPVQLHLHEYRSDIKEYPYLLLDNLTQWEGCLKDVECMGALAESNNADVAEYINIFTAGSSSVCEGCCADCSLGYSTPAPTAPEAEEEKGQYIALMWDVVDPAVGNNDNSFQLGAVTLIQELGHYLGGLLNTHEGGCEHKDMVKDTPAELPVHKASWYADLKEWCIEQRDTGDLEGLLPGSTSQASRLSKLDAFKSCEDNQYSDNVMNYMSSAPHECRVQHSAGQVQQYITVMTYSRPQLMSNSLCTSRA